MDRRLYKREEGRVICGVCSGLAEFFHLDPTLIRLVFAALTIFGGSGVILYLAAAFIIPKEPDHGGDSE